MSVSNEAQAVSEPPSRVFRWLNFGSCLFRIGFDTPQFYGKPYNGLPVQVRKIWRRDILALVSDWEVRKTFAKPLGPTLFSEAWLSSSEIFAEADVILVDVVMDVLQPYSLRMRRAGEEGGISFSRLISNFPEEPPKDLEVEIGAFPCDEQQSIDAWRAFGKAIKTPTVFVTLENREGNDVPRGYPEATRQRLRAFQARMAELAKEFPHWLIVSLDDIFAEQGAACYVDSHHPSPLGWEILRSTLPQLIIDSGVLDAESGGPSLPMRNWNLPERSDFTILDLEHMRRLRTLGLEAHAVGPKRLTAEAREAFGPDLQTHEPLAPLEQATSLAQIIILRWSQPALIPPWLESLKKKHPSLLVEFSCMWQGRENLFITPEERDLRLDLKAFGTAQAGGAIDLTTIPEDQRRYVARCVFVTHRPAADLTRAKPWSDPDLADAGQPVPGNLIDRLMSIPLVPVFGPRS